MESELDAQTRSYREIPRDEVLREMSYLRLCEVLSSKAPGSTAFLVIEAEKRRRDTPDGVKNVERNPSDKPSPDHWYKRPIPVLFLGAAGTVIALCIRYVAIHYFGLQL